MNNQQLQQTQNQTQSNNSSFSSPQLQQQQNITKSLEDFFTTEEKIALIEKLESYSEKLNRIIGLLSKFISFNKNNFSQTEIQYLQSSIDNLNSVKILIDDFLKIAPVYDLETIENFYFIVKYFLDTTVAPLVNLKTNQNK